MQPSQDARLAENIDEKRALISCLLVGGVLLLFFSTQARDDLPADLRSTTVWAFIIGLLFFTSGLLVFQNEKVHAWWSGKLEKVAGWFGVNTWQLILLIMSPAFAVLAINAAGYSQKMYSPVVAVAAWSSGIALAIVGGIQWGRGKIQLSRSTWLWTLFVTALAFLIRSIATDRIPIFLTGDEGSAGIVAMNFIKGEWNNIFTTGWFSFPSFFSFLQSFPIRAFGQSIEALRIPSAFIGALTVAATYLCGRKMFGHRAGLLAALFLSALHYHIHFSRIGLNNIWDGLWYVITIGALWYGWQHESRGAYVVAGVGLGFSQYFYSSSRMLFGIVLAAILLAAILQRPRLRRAWSHLVVMVLIAIAIVLPLAAFYIKEPAQFLAPFQRVSVVGGWLEQRIAMTGQPAWQILLQQIGLGFQAYTLTPVIFWYSPETSILRPAGAVLFYIGLIFFLLQDRDSRFALLALWLIAFGFVGGLSESAPASQRYVAAAPVCALIVGYALHKSARIGEQLWPKLSKVFVTVVYVVLVLVMLSDLNFYFSEYTFMSQISNTASHGTIAQYIANYLQPKSADVQVAFFGSPVMGYYSIPSIQYLAPQVTGINISIPWAEYDRSNLTSQSIVFIFLPERQGELTRVMEEYPGGTLKVQQAWNSQILFWIYDYSAKQ